MFIDTHESTLCIKSKFHQQVILKNNTENGKIIFVLFLTSPIIFSFFFLVSFHRAEQKTHLPCWSIFWECTYVRIAYWLGNRFVKLEIASVDDGIIRYPFAILFVSLSEEVWDVDNYWVEMNFWHQQAHYEVAKNCSFSSIIFISPWSLPSESSYEG